MLQPLLQRRDSRLDIKARDTTSQGGSTRNSTTSRGDFWGTINVPEDESAQCLPWDSDIVRQWTGGIDMPQCFPNSDLVNNYCREGPMLCLCRDFVHPFMIPTHRLFFLSLGTPGGLSISNDRATCLAQAPGKDLYLASCDVPLCDPCMCVPSCGVPNLSPCGCPSVHQAGNCFMACLTLQEAGVST